MFSREPVRYILIPVAIAAFAAAAQAFIAGADTRAIITAVLGALVIAAQEFARSLVTPTAKLKWANVGRRVTDEGGYADGGLLLVLLVIFIVILAGGFFASKLLWLLLLVVLLVALLG